MDSLIDKLDGIISKRFFFGYFLPLLIFFTANYFLAINVLPKEVVSTLNLNNVFFDADNNIKIGTSSIFLLLVLSFSYVASPFSGLARELLEGQHWISFAQNFFTRLELAELARFEKRISQLEQAIDQIKGKQNGWTASLKEARNRGVEKQKLQRNEILGA